MGLEGKQATGFLSWTRSRGWEHGGRQDQAGQGEQAHDSGGGQALPLAARVPSASPHEVTLVAATLNERFVVEPPARLLGDRAYDSDRLDEALLEEGIELIAPNRGNRRQRTQDGRPLRRWKVERLFRVAP